MNHIFIDFASPILLILKGLLVGIIASAPMGPVGILCIQRTMQKGRAYGIVTGAGAALSDIIYALMTGLGMSFVMDFIDKEQKSMGNLENCCIFAEDKLHLSITFKQA